MGLLIFNPFGVLWISGAGHMMDELENCAGLSIDKLACDI